MNQYKNEWCNLHRTSAVDSCKRCDEETPYDRKAYWREFKCAVKVRNIDWLTLDGMTPEEGWDGLQKFLRDEFKSLAWNLQKRDIVLDYDIWTGEPEEA